MAVETWSVISNLVRAEFRPLITRKLALHVLIVGQQNPADRSTGG